MLGLVILVVVVGAIWLGGIYLFAYLMNKMDRERREFLDELYKEK